MVGLYDGLYLAGNCRESEFSVWDGEAGLVGVGEMGADVGGGGEGGRGGEGRGGEGEMGRARGGKLLVWGKRKGMVVAVIKVIWQ